MRVISFLLIAMFLAAPAHQALALEIRSITKTVVVEGSADSSLGTLAELVRKFKSLTQRLFELLFELVINPRL
jgi:hypothetical protein